METKSKDKDWVLNTPLQKLPVNERKESLILLFFLNLHREEMRAFKALQEKWIDRVYKLPKTSSKTYKSVKNGRYLTLKRMRELFNKYLVRP